ncbi:MAG: hypothetical protein ACI93T_004224, partial [Porticoccaceae bacterium]
MRIRPGRNLIRLLSGILVASLFVFVAPRIIVLALPVIAVLAALAVWDGADGRRRLASLKVVRKLPRMAGRDMPFQVTWQLERPSSVSLSGELRDCLPREADPFLDQLPFHFQNGETNTELKSTLRIPVRGEFHFGPIWLRLHGRLGLIEVQKPFDIADSVRVFPEIYHSPEQLKKDSGAEIVLLDK